MRSAGFFFRLIAVFLALVLLIPAMVVAHKACLGTCACCTGVKAPVSRHACDAVPLHTFRDYALHDYRNMIWGSQHGLHEALLNPFAESAENCAREMTPIDCHMTRNAGHESAKGPSSSIRIFQYFQSLLWALAPTEVVPTDPVFLRIAWKDSILSKPTSVPLYLQTLSILC